MRLFRSSRRAAVSVTRGLALAWVLCAPLPASGDPAEQAEAAYQAGVEALRARQYAEAIEALKRAAGLRPAHFDTWLKLGLASSASKDTHGAIAAYGRAVELDPTHAKAQHNLANARYRAGELEQAAQGYGRALEIDPDYQLAAFHHGWTLRLIGRSEEAEQAFRHCLDLPASDARAMKTRIDCVFGLGSLRHRAGDYQASSTMMEQVLRVHPSHTEARYYLGIAYRQLGRLDAAAEQLEIHRQMLRARRQHAPPFDGADDP